MDLHHQRVTGAIQHLTQRLPFPLREWHSDEFVNAALLGWCQHRRVRFTRGRPYRKNDRYSSRAAWAVLQRLYGLLRLPHNFFRPVRKLRSKRRLGSKVLKRCDDAHTPYQRVLAAGGLPTEPRQALAAQLAALDPIPAVR